MRHHSRRGGRGSIHNRKDDVGLVADGFERRRRDHDDHKVERPVRRGRQRIGRCTNP